MRRSGLAKLLALLLALALVAAACGNDDDGGTDAATDEADSEETTDEPAEEETDAGTEEAETEATEDTDAAEPEETEEAETATGDVLAVSLSTDVNLIEPHLFRSTGAYAVTRALYQPLLDQVYNEEDGVRLGTAETVPSPIIESVDTSADGTEHTFTVAADAAFADGNPITAQDIVYTITRSIDAPDSYIPLLLPFIAVSSSDQVEVIDDQTFVISADQPTALFNRFMTFQVFGPLNQELAESNATEDDPFAFDYFTTEANSSGPYALASWDQASGEIVLEPNPGYPGEVNNAGINIVNVPDAEQRAQLLQRGDLDVATGLPPRLLAQLADDDNVTVYTAPSSRINYIGLNPNIEPLDNPLVRQAISYAIPYEALLSEVMFGFASPAGTLITSPMETYQGDEAGVYTTDLERAQELMDESGVGEFSIELAVQQSRAQDQQAAVFIQDALRQIGIDVNINALPDSEYSAQRDARELPMFFHEWFSWGDDPFYQLTFLATCGAFTNFVDSCNERLDEIVAEGTFETDPDRRNELSLEAQEIMVEDASRIYLWAADWTLATQADVTGVTKDFTEVPRLETLGRG